MSRQPSRIEELKVVLGRRSLWGKRPSQLEVHGTPLHMTADELLRKYKRTSLDDFLAHESRYGVGNYAIVDVGTSQARVITAPGYCGGYIRTTRKRVVVATTLRDAISVDRDELAVDPAQLALFLSYSPNTTYGLLPFQGFFDSTVRLHAAAVLEARHSGVTSYRSYLRPDTPSARPASALDAILETAESAVSANSAAHVPTSLMFSGGADSLAILLALHEVAGKDATRPIAVRTSRRESPTNGHFRAVPVARALGIDLELITDDWETDPKVIGALISGMKNDFTNTRKPDLALVALDTSPVILHGQNMDSLVGNAMVSPETNLNRPLLSQDQLALLDSDAQHLQQLRTFLKNLVFTQPYLDDETFQRWVTPYLSAQVPMTQLDPATGTELGVIRGALASQYPNLLNKTRKPFSHFDQLALFDMETSLAEGFLGDGLSLHERVDALRYYGYGQLCAKRGCTTALPNGSGVYFFPMSGPMQSYFMAQERSLSSALSPKHEIYDIIRRLSGREYSDLKPELNSDDHARLAPITTSQIDPKFDPFLEETRPLLDPESSRLLPLLPDEKTRKLFVRTYTDVVKGSFPEAENYSYSNTVRSRYLVNMELLLS